MACVMEIVDNLSCKPNFRKNLMLNNLIRWLTVHIGDGDWKKSDGLIWRILSQLQFLILTRFLGSIAQLFQKKPQSPLNLWCAQTVLGVSFKCNFHLTSVYTLFRFIVVKRKFSLIGFVKKPRPICQWMKLKNRSLVAKPIWSAFWTKRKKTVEELT